MSGHAVKEYYVARHVASTARDMFQVLAGVGPTPHTVWNSHYQLHVFSSLKKQLWDSQTKMWRLWQYSGSSNRPEKNVWKHVYSELYIKVKCSVCIPWRYMGDLGCSFTLIHLNRWKWAASHPSHLTSREKAPSTTQWEAGWAADPIWMLCEREISLISV